MTRRPAERPDMSPDRRERTLSNPYPRPLVRRVDLDAVHARYHAIAGTRTMEDLGAALIASVVDVPALASEVDELRTWLAFTRRQYADLLAAARATLAAAREGETDPLYYLRDELAAQQGRPA